MFSESVLTKNKAGKTELRALESRGKYILCKYLDSKTLKTADKKRKLVLKDEEGNVKEYFIIPLQKKRALLITAEEEKKNIKIWNEKTRKEENLW